MSQKKLIDTDLLGRFKTLLDGIIGDKDDLETTNKSSLVAAINEVNGNAGTNVKASIADDFSTSVNYAVGDFCYHLGTLYKCTTAHSAGAWNAAHFTATQVGDEIGELKNTLSGLTNLIVMEEVEVAFKGTVTPNTYSYVYLENIAKAGYKIVSLQPRLVSPEAHLNMNVMVFGPQDQQIIAKCNFADSTGSYTDPVFCLRITYLKITN